jgi:hypothetical protein
VDLLGTLVSVVLTREPYRADCVDSPGYLCIREYINQTSSCPLCSNSADKLAHLLDCGRLDR